MIKYEEISRAIAAEIDQNVFAEGEKKLPTEKKELAARFLVSRETIRKALKHLIEIGKVNSVQARAIMFAATAFI